MAERPQVDFYVYSTVNVFDWAPVVRGLQACGVDARFVLDPPETHRSRPIQNGVRENTMSEANLRMLYEQCLDQGLRPLLKPRYESASAVTNAEPFVIEGYVGKRIRMQYGVSAITDSYSHGAVNQGFDVLLAHGPFSAEPMAEWGVEVVQVGFPKYELLSQVSSDEAGWVQRWHLDPSKKTIAYFSTWSVNSSVDRFAVAAMRLAENYNVIYKPHAHSRRFDGPAYDALRNSKVMVDDETHVIVPFIHMADLVIADNRSGAFTEPMLLDTPVIGLSARGDLSKDNLIEGIEEAAALCDDPDELEALVEAELENDTHAEGRRRFRDMFFAGATADAAVTAISEAVATEHPAGRPTVPEGRLTIVLSAALDDLDTLKALDALSEQTVDMSHVQVSLVDVNNSALLAQAYGAERWNFHLDVVPVGLDGVSRCNDAARRATSDVVIFTDARFVATSQFVESHLRLHDASPTAVGFGRQELFSIEPALASAAWTKVLQSEAPSTPWMTGSASNLSVARSLLGDNDFFDDRITSRTAQYWDLMLRVTDLAARIEAVDTAVYDPREVDTKALRSRSIEQGLGCVELLAKHPSVPLPVALRRLELNAINEMLGMAQESESNLTLTVREMGGGRASRLNTFGAQVAQIGGQMDLMLQGMLTELRALWLLTGAAKGLTELEVDSFDALRKDAFSAFPSSASVRVLAFPDLSDAGQLDALMRYAREHLVAANASLCVGLGETDASVAETAISAAYERAVPDEANLDVCLSAGNMATLAVRRATEVLPQSFFSQAAAEASFSQT